MKQLTLIRDRIVESRTHLPISVFLNNVRIFQANIGHLLEIGALLERLPYNGEVTLNIVDFDDTLYGRYIQLQSNDIQDNRGEVGNTLIREKIGFRNFIEKFYTRSGAVQRILGIVEGQTDKHKSLILTAGISELQEMKIDAVKISRQQIPLITVQAAKDKPKMTIHHIIHSLKFIPGKIIIYEDRPEYFIDVIESLRQLFPRTEIVIDKVTLNPPGMSRQIKSIQQDIYLAQ